MFEALSHRITVVFKCSIHDCDCSGDSTSLKLVQFPTKDFKILPFCFIPNSVFLTLTVCLPSPFGAHGAQEPFHKLRFFHKLRVTVMAWALLFFALSLVLIPFCCSFLLILFRSIFYL